MDALIRIKTGYSFEGEGEVLGTDYQGQEWSFWKSSGKMPVPIDLALKLEREVPQRYEMVDRKLAEQFLGMVQTAAPSEPALDLWVPLVTLEEMTKDELNDWGAKRGYDVNPGRQNRPVMIVKLREQIEARTGRKVE